MDCRFCGQSFDTEDALHAHQTDKHDEVDTEVLRVLDHDPDSVVEEARSAGCSIETLLDAERELLGREEVIRDLTSEHVAEGQVDVSEELSLIDKVKEGLASMADAKGQKEELQGQTGLLEDEVSSLKEDIASLREQRENLKDDMEELREERVELKDEIDQMRGDIEVTEQEARSLRSTIKEYSEKKDLLSEKLEELDRKLRESIQD